MPGPRRSGRRRRGSRPACRVVEPNTASSRHQIRCSAAGGFGPDVAPQTTIRASRAAEASERSHVAAPTCSTTTWTPSPVSALTRAGTSSTSWSSVSSAPSRRACSSFRGARRGDDRPGAEPVRDRERRRRDAAADAPDQHPLVRLEARLRDEHPVGGLEDEREGGSLLEAEAGRNGVHRAPRHRDQLGVGAVAVLAEDARRRRLGRSSGRSRRARPSRRARRRRRRRGCAASRPRAAPGGATGRGGSARPPAAPRAPRPGRARDPGRPRTAAPPGRPPRGAGSPSRGRC